MKPKRINSDKPHLWKADIAASVDQLNEWFMRFAPEAFRSTRVKTTEHVKAALVATGDLRKLDAATLKANPSALPTLRMCTAPPLAVDRLVGLADASKSLVGRFEHGKLPVKMSAAELDTELMALCRILTRLLDRDIFPWLDAGRKPTDHERDRASMIVADRLCSAVANPIVRNAQEQRQLSLVGDFLDNLLVLYPRKGLAAMLRKHPERAAEVHALLSRLTGHELRGEGRVYDGGLHKIEPNQLARISALSFVDRWHELGFSVIREEQLSLFE